MSIEEIKNEKSIDNNMKTDNKVIHCKESTKTIFLEEMDKAGYTSQNDFLLLLIGTWKAKDRPKVI